MTRAARPPWAGEAPRGHSALVDFLADRHHRLGDVLTAGVSGEEVVVCCGAAGTKSLFAVEHAALEVHSGRFDRELFGRAVLNLRGREHLDARRMLWTVLTGDHVADYAARARTVTARHVSGWARARTVDLYAAVRALTTDVCAQVVLGLPPNHPDSRALPRLLDGFTGGVDTTPTDSTYRRALAARDALSALCARALAEPAEGMVSAVAAHAADVPPADLPAHVVSLLTSTRDFAARLITWLLADVACDPDLLERVRHDSAAILQDPCGRPAGATSVLSDTARRRSPHALSMRRAVTDCRIGGFAVPRGTRVAFSPAANSLVAPGAPSLAFGHGLHRCPGQQFAESLALTTASTVFAGQCLILPCGRPLLLPDVPLRATTAPVPAAVTPR